MQRLGLFLGIVCLAACGESMAFNPVQGRYVGAIGTISYPSSLDFYVVPETGTTIPGSLSYRIGGGGGIILGYRCTPWRFEGEALFNYNNYSKLTFGGIEIEKYDSSTSQTTPLSMKGETYFIAGMFNVFYDLYQIQASQDTQVVPYIGLGIGYASIHNKLDLYSFDDFIGTVISTSDGEGAVQFIIGAQYFADDFTSVGLDYRFFTTKKIGALDERFNVHTLNLTLNFAFDSSDFA